MMKNVIFRNGDKMPMLGLGTWKSKPGEVKNAVFWALEAGYRHIDCAAIYGNEKEVGEGLAEAIRAGIVQRSEVFLTSKLWNDSHRYEDVGPALDKTLEDLGVDYLNLYLIHWPISFKHGVGFATHREEFYTYEDVPLTQTWSAMQEEKASGKSLHIGVSNFNSSKLMELIKMKEEVPEMNQIEMHPFLPQEKLVDFCRQHQILLTAYSPLGSPDSRGEKHQNDPKLLTNPVIREIARKHGVSEGQVLIAWSMARDVVVIPKSVNQSRIIENLKSADLKLDEQDLMEIRDIGISHRYVDGTFFTQGQSPYELSDLWE